MELTQDNFPDLRHLGRDFVWGVATSSFQIEGASSAAQRGASIWDAFCARPGAILDGSHGLRACEHVDRLEEDLDLIASLGVTAYRYSISWPRVQPDGMGAVNPQGLDFYERLTDGLLERGVQPYATLYHWDLPLALQRRYGGWYGRETVDRFADYADTIARHLGDRTTSIATINEPWVVAMLGHEHGVFAPGLKSRELALQVAHHLLVAHGLGAQAIRSRCKTKVGIVLNMSPIHPLTNSDADVQKARIDDGMINRWYMDALFNGRYPQDIIDHYGTDAPEPEAKDFATIAQPIDFLGVNYYTRNFASTGDPWSASASGAAVTDMGWEIYPAGLTELLVRLHRDWSCPAIFVTENGAAFPDQLVDGAVDDRARIEYLATHIAAVDEAASQGVPMAGYFVWSLMDNFEWSSGYLRRFGIVYTEYDSLERTPKASALWYADLLGRLRRAGGAESAASTTAR